MELGILGEMDFYKTKICIKWAILLSLKVKKIFLKNRESSQGLRWQLDIIYLNTSGTACVSKVIKYRNKYKPLENRFEFI